jgi:hypothetical protein
MGEASASRSTAKSMFRGIAVALCLAVPALALASGTALALPTPIATLAPIGGTPTTETGPWSISVFNPGPETLTKFKFEPGAGAVSDIVPSGTCVVNAVNNLLECTQEVAAGATAQMCYLGAKPVELLGVELLYAYGVIESGERFTAGTSSSCPVAGFAGGTGAGGGSTAPTNSPTGTSTPPGSTAPTTPTAAKKKCVVPNVQGKKLAKAEKSIVAAHCAVGKVKHSHSRHVKKGYVISQGTRKGKSLASGTKIALTVSSG